MKYPDLPRTTPEKDVPKIPKTMTAAQTRYAATETTGCLLMRRKVRVKGRKITLCRPRLVTCMLYQNSATTGSCVMVRMKDVTCQKPSPRR